MDLYRFFHPHHNPRLRSVKIRLQELTEISLAIKEISRVLMRSKRRLGEDGLFSDNMDDTINAIDLAHSIIETTIRNYPEDSPEDLENMLVERTGAPGWEAWCKLVESRLDYIKRERDSRVNEMETPLNELDDSIHSVFTEVQKKKINEL